MILAITPWAFSRPLVGDATAMALESATLRHRLTVLSSSARRPRLTRWERTF